MASSAASVILSSRRARISGSDSMRLDRLLGAGHDAALRPAQELVAREQHQVGAGCDASVDSRLVAALESGSSGPQRTRADVVDGPESVVVSQPHQILELGDFGEPDDPEIAAMHPQDRRRLRARSLARSPSSRVLLVVPTSRSLAPETSKISGSRKLPPISTSCPRETITSRPPPGPGAPARSPRRCC